jgi:hypothetical protein
MDKDEHKKFMEHAERMHEQAKKLLKQQERWQKEVFGEKLTEKNVPDKIQELVKNLQASSTSEDIKNQKSKMEPEEINFLSKSKDRVHEWMDEQDVIEGKLTKRIDYQFSLVSAKDEDRISKKYDRLIEKVQDQAEEKGKQLQAQFSELLPIAYFTQKVSIESNSHKKIVQLKQQELKALDEALQGHKDYNPEEAMKFRKEIEELVRKSRQEKQAIEKHLVSNLEPASELAMSLLDELGPDYTGGDD